MVVQIKYIDKDNKTIGWPLVGNDRARDYLTRILLSGNPAGSYIFSGAEGLGKTAAAKWLAQNLLVIENDRDNLEVSGDFYLVEREESKKNISLSTK